MAKKVLSPLGAEGYIERGYGQVEPNHLSAQRTGQIYAQLPAAASIDVLENGQFVKYNYKDGVVDFAGAGEWMLVYNEVKVYRDGEGDADFALIKDRYNARVYSPIDGTSATPYKSVDWSNEVAPADPYAVNSTADPMGGVKYDAPALMADGTKMVPRVFKTNVGDIFTTNTIKATTLAAGDQLAPGADGYLAPAGEGATGMVWQVVKVYNLPDHQKAVKIMRIA